MILQNWLLKITGCFALATASLLWAETANLAETDPSLAAVGPMPGALNGKRAAATDRLKEIEKIDKDYVFIACNSESDCLREIQDAEVSTNQNDDAQTVAEYIEAPSKGMVIYKPATKK